MLFAHVHLDSRPNRFFCDPKKLVSNCLADVSVTAIPTHPRWHTSDQNSLVTFERHRGRTVGGFSLLTDNHFMLFSRETSLSLGLIGLIGCDDNYTSEDCKWAAQPNREALSSSRGGVLASQFVGRLYGRK